MALNLKVIEAARNAMMDQITAEIDSVTAGSLTIYDGTQATNPAEAIGAQQALAIITLNFPSFAAASGGVIVGDIAPALATTGLIASDATWFRIKDSAGDGIVDGTVGVTGGGFDLELNTVTISVGVAVEVTQLDLTAGNA